MSVWTPPSITGVTDPENREDEALFSALNLSTCSSTKSGGWTLSRISGALALQNPEGLTQLVDFSAGKTRHRSREAGHGAAPLKKALGISAFEKRHARKPRIIDATGGWGQDAWLMASMECDVTLIEQHAVVHALLQDALSRARANTDSSDTAQRIELHCGNASVLLNELHADVIYLDPMYPHRSRKKADSKKGMQILQALLGPADDAQTQTLLDAALENEAARVIVKRPKGAEVLEPTRAFTGQRIDIHSPNTRYDVYLSHAS